jgi:hypothetical protein
MDTPEQRLFISWATIWRAKFIDEALKNQVKTDLIHGNVSHYLYYLKLGYICSSFWN